MQLNIKRTLQARIREGFAPPGKNVLDIQFKIIGHSLKIWSPLRKSFAPQVFQAGYGPEDIYSCGYLVNTWMTAIGGKQKPAGWLK